MCRVNLRDAGWSNNIIHEFTARWGIIFTPLMSNCYERISQNEHLPNCPCVYSSLKFGKHIQSYAYIQNVLTVWLSQLIIIIMLDMLKKGDMCVCVTKCTWNGFSSWQLGTAGPSDICEECMKRLAKFLDNQTDCATRKGVHALC